jgi:hypothetical protein
MIYVGFVINAFIAVGAVLGVANLYRRVGALEANAAHDDEARKIMVGSQASHRDSLSSIDTTLSMTLAAMRILDARVAKLEKR